LQYPKSLPNLIKTTFGKTVGVVDKSAVLDPTIGLPNYYPRLGLTILYYGENLEENFTVPLLFLILAALLYIGRCDDPQIVWFVFLGLAFFFLGFMLYLLAPQEGFDFEHNLQYKVFHLPSHCILVLLMGYGALAAMIYLHESLPEVEAKMGAIGFGVPALFLALLPFWSNFDECSQAGHWFGYNYGTDMMRPMEKNAVYMGGSDPGRFVPTFMAFVESQQPDEWKRDSSFDRRDVTVITQNALCDTFYTHYIRDQYDPRFRPSPAEYTPFEKWLGRDQAYPEAPVYMVSLDELRECWREYEERPDVAARIKTGGMAAVLRSGTNDVFDINGIVAKKIFERNKKDHTFYLEQSIPMDWTYPYLLPSGLILKLNPEPMSDAQFAAKAGVAEDYKFWDAYSARLLRDPRFHSDDDATGSFGKLAFWHSDLYHYRHMDKEEEHWLKMALALCPHLQDAVTSMAHLLAGQQRFDEAVAVVKQAEVDDPRNEAYAALLDWVNEVSTFGAQETALRGQLAKSPYDVNLNLDLAQLLDQEGKYDEVNQRLRTTAALTNWTHDAMASVIQYYVDTAHNPEAAIAFLEARAKIDPKASEMIYSLSALEAAVGRKDEAMKYLTQAVATGGTNALMSAEIDPRFQNLKDDPRFQALESTLPATTNHAPVKPPAPGAGAFPASPAPAPRGPTVNSPAVIPPAKPAQE
jgi:tetratricopeptide (TPR) repeat protein